jgi:hypothetical protein
MRNALAFFLLIAAALCFFVAAFAAFVGYSGRLKLDSFGWLLIVIVLLLVDHLNLVPFGS